MTVVQQILYTREPERWWALAGALGFAAPFAPSPAWGEFHADGVLAVHEVTDPHAPGQVDLHLLVEDLDAAASELSAFDVSRSTMDGVGEMLTVRASSGIAVTVSAGAVERTGEVSVQPIWFQDDLAEPRAMLTALGLRPVLAADRGGWVDLRGRAGAVGLHTGTPGMGLSFEVRGDIDALAARLRDAGFDAAVIDEAYTRTVRIPDPDGGAEIWVNGVQDDLHGYHREG